MAGEVACSSRLSDRTSGSLRGSRAFVIFAGSFWFLCDDAYISFRFSRNWAHGLGVVFNPGEHPPVEGYSNFLWVALGAVVEFVGAPIEIVMPVLSWMCGIGLLLRIGQIVSTLTDDPTGRHLAVGVFALSPATAVWATSGLATMPFAWLFFELVARLVLPSQGDQRTTVTALAVALALIRVEGPLWIVLVVLVALGRRALDGTLERSTLQRWIGPVGVLSAVYVVYTAWRIHHFGTWVPNTALVKVGFDGWLALRGFKYVAAFLLTAAIPLVAWGLAMRSWRVPRVAALLALVAAVFGYAVVVGGDFMPFGRLLLPALPLTSLLLGTIRLGPRALGVATVALSVGALPLLGVETVPDGVLRVLHFRHSDKTVMSELERWANQRDNCIGFARRGRALATIAEPGDAIVAGAVGAIGYTSDLEVFDQHGLVTKEVAYRPAPDGPPKTSPGHDKHVDPGFFVKYAPRFLFARTVSGPVAAGRMKDTLQQWSVPIEIQDRYVPDFFDVTEPNDEERTFVVVVRRRTADEDPKLVWEGFASRRRALNAEIRDTQLTQD